jgi:outer membrane protein OmpA-like peptidoglycan-associated protein
LLALQLEGQQLPYYVVIGAYSIESNAQRTTLQAHALNYPAIYGFNAEKKFFYVYVRVSSEKEKALTTLADIRKEGFRDAWIFQGSLQYSSPNPVATTTASEVKVNESTPLQEPKSDGVIEINAADIASINEDIVKSDSIPQDEGVDKPAKPAGRGFVFKLMNKSTGNPVTGMVRLQENDRSNQFRPFVANNLVYVVPPVNKSGRWFMVCQVVGYKPLRTYFDYKDAEIFEGVTLGNEQEIILPVPLERVKRGDYVEMDEVRFYTNTSIMMPESEPELKELLAMMTENPDYKIRIHGHTNGSHGRDIVSLGESQDLFHTNTSNKKHAGSAKELSLLRAESVKQYLVNNGIDESRIDVKGEGGVHMLFDPKTTLAAMNDRIEAEITKH